MEERPATLGGLAAILLWSSTALLFSLSKEVPPILVLSLANIFSFFILSTRWVWKKKNPLPYFTGNFPVLLWTMFGLGFQSLCFLYAVRWVPVGEATLINYLWPMLTVLTVSALPGHKFRPEYIIGGLIGLAGATIAVYKPETLMPSFEAGHYIAFIGAASWAFYSAGIRLLKRHPGDFTTAAFLCNSVLLFFLHVAVEPAWTFEWRLFWIIALLGTLSGIAYLLWDTAMKHGHAQIVSVASNSMALLSTLYLIGFGEIPFSWTILLSALLIVAGTLIASLEKLRMVFTKRRSVLKSEAGALADTDTS
ncbi:MAG: EamA family transporter [Alphaproteobacteria bacterium]|nr:EamA family transporter [Alphaproteobacteria bacterium]MCB9974144.1 EamA family transporter [Rhodospirillales bacterium]